MHLHISAPLHLRTGPHDHAHILFILYLVDVDPPLTSPHVHQVGLGLGFSTLPPDHAGASCQRPLGGGGINKDGCAQGGGRK